jgi:hypothetical protein
MVGSRIERPRGLPDAAIGGCAKVTGPGRARRQELMRADLHPEYQDKVFGRGRQCKLGDPDLGQTPDRRWRRLASVQHPGGRKPLRAATFFTLFARMVTQAQIAPKLGSSRQFVTSALAGRRQVFAGTSQLKMGSAPAPGAATRRPRRLAGPGPSHQSVVCSPRSRSSWRGRQPLRPRPACSTLLHGYGLEKFRERILNTACFETMRTH